MQQGRVSWKWVECFCASSFLSQAGCCASLEIFLSPYSMPSLSCWRRITLMWACTHTNVPIMSFINKMRCLHMICLDLLYHSFHLVSQDEALETITTAAVCLFSTQTQLADQVPPLGHLPRILAALNHKNNTVPKSSIRLIHVLSENEVHLKSGHNNAFYFLKIGCFFG